MQLQVNDARHLLREDPEGRHFIVDGITDVIDPQESLSVVCMGIVTTIPSESICMQPDDCGNMSIVLPLSSTTTLRVLDVLRIDDHLVNILRDTPLFRLVENRVGCLAVSGYKVSCD